MSDKDKTRPRGRPKASGIRKLSKSVTVKFSRIDYERLLHRSRQANRTLAEFIREAAFEARIVARHSTEEAAVIRNLVGMANNLNQLARLSHPDRILPDKECRHGTARKAESDHERI